jgi:hypothetical protein
MFPSLIMETVIALLILVFIIYLLGGFAAVTLDLLIKLLIALVVVAGIVWVIRLIRDGTNRP